MIRNVEAVVEKNGVVHLLEKIELSSVRRAIVTILDDDAITFYQQKNETAFISEPSLANDWNNPEEDEAWSRFQQAK